MAYFKVMTIKAGVSQQRLANLYLRDCVAGWKGLTMRWVAGNGCPTKVAEARRPYGSSKRK